MKAQSKFEDALINFLALSKVLDNDLKDLLKTEDSSDSWKRNYIRVSIALIEGYCYCLREFCLVALETGIVLSNKRSKAIKNESKCSTNDRIKLTIQSAYEVFKLESSPDFSRSEWQKAKKGINKRNELMHPKSLEGLNVSSTQWDEFKTGIDWLVYATTTIIEKIDNKYEQQRS